MKSTVDQIRERFDRDVERFSNLETGQTATTDASLCMDLITHAAAATTPNARDLLDLGCGAGNYTLKLLQQLPDLNCTLIDLSRPMLERAIERIAPQTHGRVTTHQGDMRTTPFGENTFDIIFASASLHHLRTDEEWQTVFQKIYQALKPGGSFWVFDLIEQATAPIQKLMQERYGTYLSAIKGGGDAGNTYRDHVFAYIDAEDTPRSLLFQLELMRDVGFVDIDILHKNTLFAAFGGRRND